jgi:hypothetical protein
MLAWLPLLLADDPVANALGGASGWVGAGLLGGVLAWLLFIHLPAKDKQLREVLDAKDKQITDLLDKERDSVKLLTREYREGLKDVAAHCEAEISSLTVYWQAQLSSLTRAIQDMAEKIDQIRFPPRDGLGAVK